MALMSNNHFLRLMLDFISGLFEKLIDMEKQAQTRFLQDNWNLGIFLLDNWIRDIRSTSVNQLEQK